MKKLILCLFVFQLLCVASFSQEKKPTKQETMDWIASKFKNNIKEKGAEFISHSKDVITIRTPIYYGKTEDYSFYEIDLLKVTQVITVDDAQSEIFKIAGKELATTYKDSKNKEIESTFYLIFYARSEKAVLHYVIDFGSESNLKERMIKAFQTLAEYNNAEKPKEAF